MNLHRSEKVPQWELVSEPDRNPWQKIAAATAGIVTPGNFVSGAGMIGVFAGLYLVENDELEKGIVALAAARAADLLDGYAAEKTGTKSPLGEAVDVIADKIEMAAALPVFYWKGILPKSATRIFLTQNVANTAVTWVGKKRDKEIHSSRAGKLNTAGQWLAAAFYGGAVLAGLHSRPGLADNLETAAQQTLTITSLLGIQALAGYSWAALSR